MGTTAGGIIIKNTNKEIEEVAEFFFGKDFIKSEYCDSRKSDCAYIGKYKDLIVVVNSDLANKYDSIKEVEQKVLDFFNNPNLIFGFKEYDSGACYGYSIFEKGDLIRRIRAVDYDTVEEEFGEPLEAEKQWLEAELINDIDENGEPNENSKLLVNTIDNEYQIPSDYKYKAILQSLVYEMFGLSLEVMDDSFTSESHFKKKEQKTEKTSVSSKGKKWWKFW